MRRGTGGGGGKRENKMEEKLMKGDDLKNRKV